MIGFSPSEHHSTESQADRPTESRDLTLEERAVSSHA